MTSAAKTSDENHVWNPDMQYAFGYHKTWARILGVWPLETQEKGAKIRFLFAVITQFMLSLSLIRNIIAMEMCGGTIDSLDVITMTVAGFISVMKVSLLRLKQDDMLSIINSAIQDWSIVLPKKSYEIMKRHACIGRAVFIIQMCCTFITAPPMVPIGPSCWRIDLSVCLFIVNLALQAIEIFVLCLIFVGCDIYIFGLVMHTCGQFEVLYTGIENFDNVYDYFHQKYMLRYFIRRHNQLLRLANNFESIFSPIIAAQIIVGVIITSVTAIVLLINLNSGNLAIIIGLIIRIYLFYAQLLLYCYIGETLSTKAEKVQISIYNCSWYRMPCDIVRDMRFIIMRNNHRFKLTAGKMYVMDFENFKNLVKTMASYFTVLRLMFIEDE